MTELTVETIKASEGYDFVRSDGLHFFLVSTLDGRAVLHLGRRWAKPPVVGLVDFDANIFGKVEAARRWILDYRT
jgi:hypothetical protein